MHLKYFFSYLRSKHGFFGVLVKTALLGPKYAHASDQQAHVINAQKFHVLLSLYEVAVCLLSEVINFMRWRIVVS